MKAHLTKRYVDSLRPAATGGRLMVYDDTLTGFGVIVQPTGKRSFFVEYGPENGRRRMTLGAFGVLTVEGARELAARRLAEVLNGADPLDERNARRAVPTYGAWAEEYVDACKRRKKDPREDERYLTPRAEPRKRGRSEAGHPAAEIGRAHV